jgi:hypothetical protein
LSIEIKDVVVGIYKYQGLRTILVPVLTLPWQLGVSYTIRLFPALVDWRLKFLSVENAVADPSGRAV